MKRTPSGRTIRFDLEQSPWFAPAIFVLFLIGILVLFSDFIFSDKMLYGSDTIQAGVFFRAMLVNHVKEFGTVPQWNPYIFCGMPYIEAFHGDIFYPLSSLKYLGNFYRMLGMNLVLHIFLAGVFMYLAARRFKLSKIAALISAACYMFAAYLVSMVAPGHDGKIFVTALFPLAVFFLKGGFDFSGLKSFFQFSMLGLVIGCIILSPHPQMSYYTLWAVAFYAAYRLILMLRAKRPIISIINPALLTVYAVVIGLLLSAIQFYPGFLYTTNYSPRADSKSGWQWSTSWSLHEEEAFGLIIPEFAGTQAQEKDLYYWGRNAFKDNCESVGVITLFLALLGLFFSRRKSAYFWGGLALFALIYALGATTPIYYLFYWIIPKVKSLRAPSMIMFLFSFSGALLAGMAIQYVRDWVDGKIPKEERRDSKWFDYILFGFPGLLLLIALAFSAAGRGMLSLWASIFYSEASTTMVAQGISKFDLALHQLPHIQSGAWMAFIFTALTAALIWLYRERKAGPAILIGLILLPMIDGIRFDSRFIDTIDPARYWSANPVSDFLEKQPGHYRTMNLGALPADMLPFHEIEVVTGYHGNQLRWFDALLGGPGAPNETNPYLLNLASARFLVYPSNAQIPPGYFGDQPVLQAASFGSITVSENLNALPPVYLVDSFEIVNNRDLIYPLILDGAIDFRKVVYLEQEPPISIAPGADSGAIDSAWISQWAMDSVTVNMICSSNRLLVMTDNYYPAWQVTVDGQSAELLRAYGTFRAVALPAGTQEVVFRYNSQVYATGKLVTTLTAIYLILVIAGFGVMTYRKRPEQAEETSENA
ncbi:MAG TPA: YfhO family protein [candidate division Zixibacteria bacterium]|nr:YfhO family protein [candidate division Zixibacteria bacterium]